MLYAYFDEAGHPSDSKVVSIASVVSTNEEWNNFDDQWRKVLDWYDIPKDKGLHLTDFENRKGVFRDWGKDDPRAIPFISELVDIFKINIQFGCVFSIIMDDWNSLIINRFPDAFERKRSPFIVLLQTCLEAIHNVIPKDQSITCMFEENKFLLGAAPAHFARWKNTWGLENRFTGALAFGQKYKYPQLQAADMLAYEGAKHILNRTVNGGLIAERKLHARLMQSQKIQAEYYDIEGLMGWLDDISKRESLLLMEQEG